jgi:quinol monooxygenase YgiN
MGSIISTSYALNKPALLCAPVYFLELPIHSGSLKIHLILCVVDFPTLCRTHPDISYFRPDEPDNKKMSLPNKRLYGFSGKFRAKEGKRDELAALLLHASEMISSIKACHIYIVSLDPQDADTIWVNEVCDSRQAHDDSLKLPGTAEFIAKAMPLIEGRPEGKELEVLGGAGLPKGL